MSTQDERKLWHERCPLDCAWQSDRGQGGPELGVGIATLFESPCLCQIESSCSHCGVCIHMPVQAGYWLANTRVDTQDTFDAVYNGLPGHYYLFCGTSCFRRELDCMPSLTAKLWLSTAVLAEYVERVYTQYDRPEVRKLDARDQVLERLLANAHACLKLAHDSGRLSRMIEEGKLS